MKNKYISDIPIFAENIIALSKASEDSAKLVSEYMTDSQKSVINFDAVKQAYCKTFGINMNVCSVDALVLQDNGIWAFIEFKNGKITSDERRNIRLKIKSSLLILCDITKVNLDFTRKRLDLYLIYNHELDENSHDKIKNNISSLAGEEPIKFNLRMYSGTFFRCVHTYSDIKFRNVVKSIVSIDLSTEFLQQEV